MKLKDNKIFRIIIIPICIALCLFGRFIPPFEGLSSDAMGVLFIFLGSLILWLTIGIDWPSLLCIFSLGFLENMSFSKVFTSSFGNTTFVFLLFTFIITYALSQTSLIKRVAIAFISNKVARKNGYFFISLFLSAVLFLGLFISPSVLFVIILPILEEIFKIAKVEKEDKGAKALMLGLGFTVSISSGMTPIAHVFPILAMNAANISISPLTYMVFAIPVGLLLFVSMLLMFFFLLRPDINKFSNIDVSSLKNELPKIKKEDIYISSIFVLVVLLWIIPSLFEKALPSFYSFFNNLGTAMPPLLGTVLLCVIRVDNKPLIKIDEALKKGVPWAALLMCASTLVLGSVLTNNDIGIRPFLETNLSSSLQNIAPILLLIIFTSWAALQTNLSSNMVTATLVATVAYSVLVGCGSSLNTNTIICLIGMLASFAFATPPSMPHIAIVAGSEYANTKDVLIYGSILMVISIVLACLVGYPLGSLIL